MDCRISTRLTHNDWFVCLKKQGPPCPWTQQCWLGVHCTHGILAQILSVSRSRHVCHNNSNAINISCNFSRLTRWDQKYSSPSFQYHLALSLASQMHTVSSVTITIITMHLHFILGQHICDLSSTCHFIRLILPYQCSIHGYPMKPWRQITEMTPCYQTTFNNQNSTSFVILTNTMQMQTHPGCQHLLHLPKHHL